MKEITMSVLAGLSTACVVILGLLALQAGVSLVPVMVMAVLAMSMTAALFGLGSAVIPGQPELTMIGGMLVGWGAYQLLAAAEMLPC